MGLVFHLACLLRPGLNNVWKQFTYLHEIWRQCHATTGDYMFCPEKFGIFVTIVTHDWEFDFSCCFTGYVKLKNAVSHREVASWEGELILPCDAVLYVVRAFYIFTSGFL